MEEATSFSSQQPPTHILELLDLIGKAQKITIDAFQANNLQRLISIILNETQTIVKYDRAILFRKKDGNVQILGVSGSELPPRHDDTTALKQFVKNLEKSETSQILTSDDFAHQREIWDAAQVALPDTVYWVPIVQGNEEVGLWLEKFNDPQAKEYFETYSPILKDFLIPAYTTAWEKISSGSFFSNRLTKVNLKKGGLITLALLGLSLLIPIHLRIVAPAEVVAKEPYVVTAPMEGIIQSIVVKPGEKVEKDQQLFSYDNKLFTARYQTALKNVDLFKSELNRSYVLGTGDTEEVAKLASLQLKLKKSQVELTYAQKQLDLTINKAPIAGLVSIDNPDSWRGKPVRTGEKILTISNPDRTKLRFWIPEKDNITISPNLMIQVFLNPSPEKTFDAQLSYVSSEAKIGEDQLPYFEAEAEWVNVDKPPRLGLKGSVVLYGEKVSFFYYLMRKPLGFVRKWIGI